MSYSILLGLGKNATENWEMCDAMCDKKQGIMWQIMRWNVPQFTNNSLKIKFLSQILILSFDKKRDVFQKPGTTDKGSTRNDQYLLKERR